jgi:hypothetical protein
LEAFDGVAASSNSASNASLPLSPVGMRRRRTGERAARSRSRFTSSADTTTTLEDIEPALVIADLSFSGLDSKPSTPVRCVDSVGSFGLLADKDMAGIA